MWAFGPVGRCRAKLGDHDHDLHRTVRLRFDLMSVLSVLDLILNRLRPKSRTRWAIAILIAVPALAACGSEGPSHRVATSTTDAHWSVLHNRVANSSGLAFNDEVITSRTRAIRVYRLNDLVAGIRYEGTFANAEAVAKRHQVPADAPPSRKKTGGWLAISNVAYFFSFASTPAEVDRVTACLTKTYPGKPKWPANVSLSTLSSPESPYT
jgi:hypothetical protein